MSRSGERHWVDPRFRERRPRSAGSRPASAGQAPCPPGTSRPTGPAGPAGAAVGATTRRRTLTPHERMIEERVARLRAAAGGGTVEPARESTPRAGRGRAVAAGSQRMQGTGAVGGRVAAVRPTGPCPPRAGAATPPAARVQRTAAAGRAPPATPRRVPTGAVARAPPAVAPPPAAAEPCVPRTPVGILRRSSSALGEVNAQLAAQAASSGQNTATRLTEAGAAGGARPKKKVRIVTPAEQECAERMSRLRSRVDEAYTTREATAREESQRGAMAREAVAARSRALAAGIPSTSTAAAAPPQAQRVVLQPGEIDPTETTVITVPPPSTAAAAAGPSGLSRRAEPASKPPCACPRSTPPASRGLSLPPARDTFDLDESSFLTGRTGSLAFLDQSMDQPARPTTIAGFPITPRRFSTSTSIGSDYQEPPYRGVSPFTSRPAREEGGACSRLPQTTVCPTTVRSVTARPISADPNVSVLQDDEFEDDLLTEEDFLGLTEEDFHLTRSAQDTPPQPPRAVSPLRDPCEGMEVPRPAVADIYREIESRKEAWRNEQMKRNQEFLSSTPMMRQDDPDRIYGRIMTNYLRRTDPGLAAAYEEQYYPGDVPVDDLLTFEDEPCPPDEFGPSARELFDAMREPDYGPYATELLSSNIQPLQPTPYQPGPYTSELLENVELCPTTGYEPGPFGAELMSNVAWEPPRMPDPYTENILIDSLPCPPPPPSDPCDLADLLDW